MKPMKTALIGCGAIAGNHLTAIGKIPGVEPVALCDAIPERAEAAKKKYAPTAAIYTDYKKMLDEARPDAVHIATPHYLHCEMACEALARLSRKTGLYLRRGNRPHDRSRAEQPGEAHGLFSKSI